MYVNSLFGHVASCSRQLATIRLDRHLLQSVNKVKSSAMSYRTIRTVYSPFITCCIPTTSLLQVHHLGHLIFETQSNETGTADQVLTLLTMTKQGAPASAHMAHPTRQQSAALSRLQSAA